MAETVTVGVLAKRFGLSRTALLYYDSIGLLSPSERSEAGYRRYSYSDVERLRWIQLYKRTGISLEEIGQLLDSPSVGLAKALESRLEELLHEEEKLLQQKRLILGLLRHPELLSAAKGLTKESWTELLSSAGFSETDMLRWHTEFEAKDGEGHQRFLETLKIPAAQIRQIRRVAQRSGSKRA